MRCEDDDEGPLADGWYDEVYSLVGAVFAALEQAAAARPPRFGEVLLAACGRLDDCGDVDEDIAVAVLRAAKGLDELAPALTLFRAHDASAARLVEQ